MWNRWRALTEHFRVDVNSWRSKHVAAYKGRIGLAKVPLLGDLVAAIRLATRTIGRGDVILVHGAEYAWGPLVVARLTRRPIVVVWHGLRFFETLPPAQSLLNRVAYRTFRWSSDLLQRIALRADATITVSPDVATQIQTHFSFCGEIHIIPNGVEQRSDIQVVHNQYPWTAFAPIHGIQPEIDIAALRVLWIGTSAFNKGLDLAVSACREARNQGQNVTLTVVGVGKEVAELEPVSSVEWLSCPGRLAPAEVERLLTTHDLLLFPTRSEACSMTVLEALAAGLPVVGSRVVEWQIRGAGEVVDDEDPLAYAQALHRLAAPEYRRKLAFASFERARSFSWVTSVASYVAVLDSVCMS